jgi:peptidoglycan/xylan/chitin deacetylase (PgdA/CDA1 family)
MKNFLQIFLQNTSIVIGLVSLSVFYAACNSASPNIPARPHIESPVKIEPATPTIANAATILQRPQIPILCYHQIRDWSASDSKRAKDYIVPVRNFCEQIKLLADSGYHTILPDQLYDYLLKGTPLPSRPIMISFDDSRSEQYVIASEEMKKYGFKGVYFIMTVSLGRPGYMTKEQVKQLFDNGNTIGSHTWDHGNVKTYQAADWEKQIDKPAQQLEKIIGKRPEYFAYPFGLWDNEAIEQIKQRGYKAAFQLSAKRNEDNPQFTIRRMIVPGEWSTYTLQKWISKNF